jgi:hypothetical protein
LSQRNFEPVKTLTCRNFRGGNFTLVGTISIGTLKSETSYLNRFCVEYGQSARLPDDESAYLDISRNKISKLLRVNMNSGRHFDFDSDMEPWTVARAMAR